MHRQTGCWLFTDVWQPRSTVRSPRIFSVYGHHTNPLLTATFHSLVLAAALTIWVRFFCIEKRFTWRQPFNVTCRGHLRALVSWPNSSTSEQTRSISWIQPLAAQIANLGEAAESRDKIGEIVQSKIESLQWKWNRQVEFFRGKSVSIHSKWDSLPTTHLNYDPSYACSL